MTVETRILNHIAVYTGDIIASLPFSIERFAIDTLTLVAFDNLIKH